MTLAQGLAIYLAERDKLRPATKATYARDLRTTFGDYLDRPLVDLTPERVRDRHKDRKSRHLRAQARVEHARARHPITAITRAEARALGKECVNQVRSTWSPDTTKKNKQIKNKINNKQTQ